MIVINEIPTEYVMDTIYRTLMYENHKTIGILAETLIEAESTLEDLYFVYKSYPYFKPKVVNKTKKFILFDNGVKIKCSNYDNHHFCGIALNILYVKSIHPNETKYKDFIDYLYPCFQQTVIFCNTVDLYNDKE